MTPSRGDAEKPAVTHAFAKLGWGALVRLGRSLSPASPVALPMAAAEAPVAADASRKRRPKAQYMQPAKRARPGGPRQLEPGMCGILITCNMNERKCVAEAYSLLGEYGEQLYGPEQFADQDEDRLSGNEEEDKEVEEDDDAEASLKKEVDQIRTSSEQKLRRFQSVESGANNVVFIRTLGVEPEKLVHHILKDMHTTKKKKTRVILRMLPVSGTCKAFVEDMKRYSETFLEPWFKSPQKGTFQIVYKARNNSHLSRVKVINELAGVVGQLNPENKVDLSNPEFTIVVEIIKSICCLSVVKDYILFRKYNLQEVVKGGKAEGPPGALSTAPAGGLEEPQPTVERVESPNQCEEKTEVEAKPAAEKVESQNECEEKNEAEASNNHRD
ncbi:THUMP domain-containing protein 1 [Varanus komodoensis]|uniref:THUMP domain-containing protein 1 n=1 Tax=Varanus komodoensis TaxID=61221 RepID=A0A8D2KTU2_VARKO|nr:THUMP domain-containing protein 1 [Varanus komodoensis]